VLREELPEDREEPLVAEEHLPGGFDHPAAFEREMRANASVHIHSQG